MECLLKTVVDYSVGSSSESNSTIGSRSHIPSAFLRMSGCKRACLRKPFAIIARSSFSSSTIRQFKRRHLLFFNHSGFSEEEVMRGGVLLTTFSALLAWLLSKTRCLIAFVRYRSDGIAIEAVGKGFSWTTSSSSCVINSLFSISRALCFFPRMCAYGKRKKEEIQATTVLLEREGNLGRSDIDTCLRL